MKPRYLLDTNLVIFVLKEARGRAANRLALELPKHIASCSVVEAELYYGAHKYGVPERRRRALDGFLAPFCSLPFDARCVRHYARIRHNLEQAGRIIGANDLLIAAIALTHDLTVVTHNCGEFDRVEGLRVEDWTL